MLDRTQNAAPFVLYKLVLLEIWKAIILYLDDVIVYLCFIYNIQFILLVLQNNTFHKSCQEYMKPQN